MQLGLLHDYSQTALVADPVLPNLLLFVLHSVLLIGSDSLLPLLPPS